MTWEVVERIPAARTGRFANRVIEPCHGHLAGKTEERVGDDTVCDACHGTVSSGELRLRARAERVRALLDRAKRYRAMLDRGEVKSMRELGRVEGISGARVCQILGVLDLPRGILERVDVAVGDIPSGISVTWLRELTVCGDRDRQLRRFGTLVGE